ncbi:hypothetical protein L1049_015751 [Liquidambar formosana]|uniref:ULTRAPETALA1/2 zinc finger domain-containing protein n=1 Tax=Liquidambar formosana TaxID=63359 RepID=A0AAP0X2Q9_LIQFO
MTREDDPRRVWETCWETRFNEMEEPNLVVLKYYKDPANEADRSSSSRGRQKCLRKEFVRCSRCNKECTFHIWNKEDCQIYHDALAKRRWKCADKPYDRLTK